MDCKQCGTLLTGRQREFCSDKCRMRHKRQTRTSEDGSGSTNANKVVVEPEQIESEQQTRTASFEDYQAHPGDYVPRVQPELLNWGSWMSAGELDDAGLKANRVAIVGDWDYTGVCYQDKSGQWHIGKDERPIEDVPSPELQRRLHYMRDWKQSPEYKEIMRRLNTQTVEQLEQAGQFVPVAKHSASGAWT